MKTDEKKSYTEAWKGWCEVYHNCPSPWGGYSSGTTRMELKDIGSWLVEQLSADKPVLVTKIVDLSKPISERE